MGFLRFVIGAVAFVIAMKLVGLILGVVFTLLHLLWIAIVVGAVVFVAWMIYRAIAPEGPQQA
ncbi:MAG TPA: hypothetical protein VLE20_10045 [Blastocatellia bacterium]|nr:hypothetical protein [Blastocatellia bacterium]